MTQRSRIFGRLATVDTAWEVDMEYMCGELGIREQNVGNVGDHPIQVPDNAVGRTLNWHIWYE